MSNLVVTRMNKPFQGVLKAPPSKYHTHRGLVLGALAEGESVITGISKSLDNMSTVKCLSLLGTKFDQIENGYRIQGGSFDTPTDILDAGNSGSTIHFLMAISSTAPGTCVFTGDASLRSRPIGPYIEALNRWGIKAWSTQGNGKPPVVVMHQDPETLHGEVSVNGDISPWTTGLVLLAPLTSRDVTIEVLDGLNEGGYTILMVEMMKDFGVKVEVSPDKSSFFVPGGQRYSPSRVEVPGDVALASFGFALAAMSGSSITYNNLDLSVYHPEAKFVEVLQEMGADVRIDAEGKKVDVIGGRRLKGVSVDCNDAPDMVPILSLVMAMAEGESRIINAAQLRIKESDRLKAMTQLNKMGTRITETEDGLLIQGVDKLHGAVLDSLHDHRVLMSFAIAGCIAEGITTISDAGSASVSYPGFISDMRELGADIQLME